MTIGERPMRADARRNHERLVSAARDAFAQSGADAPLDDIARRAGVGPGTLYRHFPTRQALLAAVYRGDVDRLDTQATALAGTLAAPEALAAWLWLMLDHAKQKRGLGSAVKAMLADDAETSTYCRGTVRGAVNRLLTAARETGDVRPDVDADDVLRLVHGLGIALESVPDHADRLLGIVLDGLRPQPDRSGPAGPVSRSPERPG